MVGIITEKFRMCNNVLSEINMVALRSVTPNPAQHRAVSKIAAPSSEQVTLLEIKTAGSACGPQRGGEALEKAPDCPM